MSTLQLALLSTKEQHTQGAKNSARTRGFLLTVSSKSVADNSRTSLDALTGEKSDNDAANRAIRLVFETIMRNVLDRTGNYRRQGEEARVNRW